MAKCYEKESIDLVNTFYHFAADHDLPPELVNNLDHVSLHATDIRHFGRIISDVKPAAEQITVPKSDERFIAAARLGGGTSLAQTIRIRWIEIIEPTEPEIRQGSLKNGGVGYYYADLEEAEGWLSARGMPYEVEDRTAKTIVTPFNGRLASGMLRISKVPLGQVVGEDINANRVTFINLNV